MLRPKQVNFQQTWQDSCQPRLSALFTPSENKLSAFELYASVYELCVAVPDNHTQRLLQSITDLLHSKANQMKTEIKGTSALLEAYLRNWRLFRDSSRALNAVCRYLNKCLAALKKPTPNSPSSVSVKLNSSSFPIETVDELCQLVWRECVLKDFPELLQVTISCWTESFINEVIESYTWAKDDSLVNALKAHLPSIYATKSQQFLNSSSVTSYIPFAAALLEVEEERLKRLLPPEMATPLLELCERELIGRHVEVLQGQFDALLQVDDHKQLLLLFSLLERNSGALGALQSSLTAHLQSAGHQLITQDGLNGLLTVVDKCNKLLTKGFNDTAQMTEAAHSALSCLLNDHLPQPAESLTEALLTAIIEPSSTGQLFFLLPLLNDFEAFYTCFQEGLARLICFPCHNPPLPDQEVASQLIEGVCSLPACSSERACHLRQMLRDSIDRRDLLCWDQDCLLSIQLLTQHSWPRPFEGTAGVEVDWFTCPEALKMFQGNFMGGESKRKLSWCPQLTSVEVVDSLTGQHYLMTPRQLQIALAIEVDVEKEEEEDDEEYQLIKSVLNSETLPSGTTKPVSLIPKTKLEKVAAAHSSPINTGLSSAADHSHLLQSLLVITLKRRLRLSPAELHKLLRLAAASLKPGHAFRAEEKEIEEAVGVLMEKGFVEFNRLDNVYIYLA